MQEEGALPVALVQAEVPRVVPGRGYIGRVWDHWKHVAHAVGVVQTRTLMMLIYATVVVPTGVLMRLVRDPLRLRPPAQGNWVETRQSERSIEAARRQS